jgi:hypothetical protein
MPVHPPLKEVRRNEGSEPRNGNVSPSKRENPFGRSHPVKECTLCIHHVLQSYNGTRNREIWETYPLVLTSFTASTPVYRESKVLIISVNLFT